MGTCISSSRVAPMSKTEQEELLLKYPKLRKSLCLSEPDFVSLYRCFVEADTQEKGTIRYREFLEYFDLDRNRFTRRVFNMFSFNKEGITFKFWVFGLWNFCTSDDNALTMFAFAMFDVRGKGILDKEAVETMLRDLFGDRFELNAHARALMQRLMKTNMDGKPVSARVTPAEFAKVAVQAKNLLYSPFQIQSKMQQRVMGRRWWMKRADERVRFSRSGTYDVEDVAEQLSDGLKKKLAVVNGIIVV